MRPKSPVARPYLWPAMVFGVLTVAGCASDASVYTSRVTDGPGTGRTPVAQTADLAGADEVAPKPAAKPRRSAARAQSRAPLRAEPTVTGSVSGRSTSARRSPEVGSPEWQALQELEARRESQIKRSLNTICSNC
jgi:hypothetical protein